MRSISSGHAASATSVGSGSLQLQKPSDRARTKGQQLRWNQKPTCWYRVAGRTSTPKKLAPQPGVPETPSSTDEARGLHSMTKNLPVPSSRKKSKAYCPVSLCFDTNL